MKNHNVLIALLVCVSLITAQTTQSTAHINKMSIPSSSVDPLSIWFDDCRNTSAWTEQTAASDYDIEGIVSGTGGLHASIYSLTVPEIPTTTYNEYGPLFTRNFSEPITVSDILDFRVRISFDNNWGEFGSLKIYLFDENRNSIFTMGISDLADDNYDYNVVFRYSPITISSWYIERYHNMDDWHDYISYWYNDAVETPFTLIGHSLDPRYKIPVNDGEVEVDRKVVSIGISWTRSNHGEYDGTHLEIESIRLIHRRPIVPVHSWHHDCSNVSQFEQVTEWSPYWWSERILTLDNISSNGESIYTPVYSGDEEDWYGPAFICSLQNSIPLLDIVRFNIQLEFQELYTADELRFDFFLFADDLRPIVRFYFYEIGSLSLGYSFGVQVFDKDLNSAELRPDHTISYSLNENFSLWFSTTAGFFGDIPDSYRIFIGDLASVQTNAKLAYFGIVPSSHEPVSDIPVYIHDIQLDYVNESDLIPTNPGSNSTITNGGANFSFPPLDQVLLWGISIASVLVISAFTIQTIRYRRESDNAS